MKKRILCALLALCLALSLSGLSEENYVLLQKGDKGDKVLALKHRMYELGYFTSQNYSNEFNDVTVKRLKELQEKNGLAADGVATPELQALIFSDGCIPKDGQAAPQAETEAVSAEPADFSEKFADQFLAEGESPVLDGMSYKSRDVSIVISASRVNKSDVYVADIYLRSLSLLRRGFEGNAWNGTKQRMDRTANLALVNNAVLAVAGDNAQNQSKGVVYENGALRRGTKGDLQLCVIFTDGEMRTYKSADATAKNLEKAGKPIWQTFLFGPGLLDEEGHALKTYKSKVGAANPRTVIGYFEPGHYCLVQIDGRGAKSLLEEGKRSTGFTMKELGDFMESLGCRAAYNLDGGQSAEMWFNDRIISSPYKGGRGNGDIVYIPFTE